MYIYSSSNEKSLENTIKNNNVSKSAIPIFQKKIKSFFVILKDISLAKALVLKQDMLVCGGDVALPEDAVRGSIKRLDVIITGNIRNYEKLILKLEKQGFFKKEIDLINDVISTYKTKKLFSIRKKDFFNNNSYIMGILNITPDSFSDGGKNYNIENAIKSAKKMIEDGAHIIDIGGESSRPGSKPVGVEEELRRVIPIIKEIRNFSNIPISIDTYRSEVAHEAIKNGADILNYIYGYKISDDMLEIIDKFQVPICLMHMRGNPDNMQERLEYNDLCLDIINEIKPVYNKIYSILKDKNKIIVDPGIGFGKSVEQNWELIKKVNSFRYFGSPILMGVSRKSFIKKTFSEDSIEFRDNVTDALTQYFIGQGINFIRVHNTHKATLNLKIQNFIN